jgi:glycosyltransferase involved in cell wall biosynthesis
MDLKRTKGRRRRRSAPDHEAAIGGAPYLRHRRIRRSRSHPRPRVLQLLATGSTGGAQESYSGLLLRLDRSKYEVRALSLSAGSAVQRLGRLGLAVDVLDETDDEAAIRELAGYLRSNEIDLIHAHMFRAEAIGVRAALAAGTPVIMATVHSSRVRSAEDTALLAQLTPQMDRLIVPSASIEAKVRAEGREGARFAVIPNGVDLSRFAVPAPPSALRAQHGLCEEALLIGVVARLEPEKGHRYLVEAMPAIVRASPHVWLAIIGEGSLAGELRALAASLPPPARERVLFVGRRDDVSAVTADLDIAVLPSLREAQGISILEAMARGKPVVASAVGGIPEVITDGVDGLLVPPADPAALADTIIRLLTDASLRTRLGESGRATAAERFSIDAQVRRIEGVYDEELARAGVVQAGPPRPPQVRPSRARRDATPRERAALEVPPL